MAQVLMLGGTDCEIPCVCNAAGLTYEQVAAVHNAINNDFRDNLNGSPYHINNILEKLKIPSIVVTDDDILNNRVDISKVIILVHGSASPTLTQHWCNVQLVEPTRVVLAWNYPGQEYKVLSLKEFKDTYRRGFPNCSFELYKGGVRKNPWYAKAWVWITNKLF